MIEVIGTFRKDNLGILRLNMIRLRARGNGVKGEIRGARCHNWLCTGSCGEVGEDEWFDNILVAYMSLSKISFVKFKSYTIKVTEMVAYMLCNDRV